MVNYHEVVTTYKAWVYNYSTVKLHDNTDTEE